MFKEEEEAVKVDLHENSGRVKLYWIVALADSKTLKGMVEFRETGTGNGNSRSAWPPFYTYYLCTIRIRIYIC